MMDKRTIMENANQQPAHGNMLDDIGLPYYDSYNNVPVGIRFNHKRLDDGSIYYLIKNEDGTWGDGVIPAEASKGYDRNFQYSNMPVAFKNKTFNDFRTDIYKTQSVMDASFAVQRAQKYVERFEEFYNDGMGLYLFSEATGSGKTLLACVIANQLIRRYGANVKFVKSVNLFEKLKKEINSKEDIYLKNDTMKSVIDAGVLIIDDLGAGNQSQFVSDKIYEIVDNRVNQNKVTIFTSRKPLKKLMYDNSTLNLIKERSLAISVPNENVADNVIAKRNKKYEDILNS